MIDRKIGERRKFSKSYITKGKTKRHEEKEKDEERGESNQSEEVDRHQFSRTSIPLV